MEDGRELELVEGTVASLIFQNEENGYTILRLERGGEELTLVGEMPGVSPGEYLSVQGRWVRHATYGAQFKAEIVERRLPQSLKEVFHYLASGAVKGVGKSTARRLVEEFGEDALRVMEEEPEKLASIKGITPKRARQISESFRQQMGMRRLMEFLGEHQLPLTLGDRPVPGLWGCGAGGAALQPLSDRGGGVRCRVFPGGSAGPVSGGGGGGPTAPGGGAAL